MEKENNLFKYSAIMFGAIFPALIIRVIYSFIFSGVSECFTFFGPACPCICEYSDFIVFIYKILYFLPYLCLLASFVLNIIAFFTSKKDKNNILVFISLLISHAIIVFVIVKLIIASNTYNFQLM